MQAQLKQAPFPERFLRTKMFEIDVVGCVLFTSELYHVFHILVLHTTWLWVQETKNKSTRVFKTASSKHKVTLTLTLTPVCWMYQRPCTATAD